MEDLIAVLDGRKALEDEIRAAPLELRTYIAEHLERWLGDQNFRNDFAGNLLPDQASQARAPLLLERMSRLVSANAR